MPAVRVFRHRACSARARADERCGNDDCNDDATTVAAAERPSKSITAIGVVTASREGSMERCLQAVLDHQRRCSRTSERTIVDDAPDASVRRMRREWLADHARQAGVPIAYAGAEEKRAFIGELAKVGIDPSVAAVALLDESRCGHSVGANRNALLLHHAGDVFFQVDDDIVCRVAVPAGTRDELCFTPGHNPNQFRFFPDRARALESATFVDRDLLASHESLLGLGIPECADALAGVSTADGTQMSDNLLRLAISGRSRVAVTQNGLIGDCGFGGCSPYLVFKGALREDLHRSEQTYRLATASREISQTVLAPTISEGAFCMSYALGLDHRTLLPPFFPVRRNPDGVFGVLLRACFEDALFGHVPVQVVHEPPECRSYRGSVWSAPRLAVNAIIVQCVKAVDFGPVTDGTRRMRMLGQHLVDVASAGPAEFLAFVRERVLINAQHQVSSLQGLLKTYDRKPAYWAADCDRYIADLLRVSVEPDAGIPADLLDGTGRTRDEALALAKQLVQQFGDLLIAWPDIVAAARQLRTQDIRLARAV